MKFDEAFEKVEKLANFEVGKTTGDIRRDFKLELGDVRDILAELREEYAPTVEMTKKQYEILVMSRNNAVNRVDKVGLLEFMGAYSLLNQEIDHLTLMRAWLYPETIKIKE